MVILGGWVFLMSEVPLYPPPSQVGLHGACRQLSAEVLLHQLWNLPPRFA